MTRNSPWSESTHILCSDGSDVVFVAFEVLPVSLTYLVCRHVDDGPFA